MFTLWVPPTLFGATSLEARIARAGKLAARWTQSPLYRRLSPRARAALAAVVWARAVTAPDGPGPEGLPR